MKCIVTAGPTYEELDEVRRMTNFSTGTSFVDNVQTDCRTALIGTRLTFTHFVFHYTHNA